MMGGNVAWLATGSLARREVVRFLRQPARLIGAIAMPLIFWLMIGAGMGDSFRPSGISSEGGFLHYFFPGIVVLCVLFSAIYSTISIIEDRDAGFLQSVLVAPVPSWTIVGGKVLGGAILALGQGGLLLALAPLLGLPVAWWALVSTFAVLALIALSLTALGFVIAWKSESSQGFHAIMNILLMPMWILSGAFFPSQGASTVLAWIMAINPLTYGLSLVRHTLGLDEPSVLERLPSLEMSLGVSVIFLSVMVVWSCRVVRSRSRINR